MPGTVIEAPVARSIEHQASTTPHVDDSSPPGSGSAAGRVVTILLVGGPLVGLTVFLPLGWGHVIGIRDAVLAAVFYVFTGFGVAAGFHRLFAHRSFRANRILKVTLAVAGSMALEGSIISWVAVHRRHHMFGDQPGDPHSPYRYGSGFVGTLQGFVWSHVGWLFAGDPTDSKRFAPDLQRDNDLVVVDKLFPYLAVSSLALPFVIGWILSGTLAGGLSAFLWAGLVRMAVLHHVTWSINSVCHLWGKTPFTTSDHSTNFAPLALLSFGESWHNFHHSAPASARHGVLPHQVDLAARLIRLFERAGWATKVRWPTPAQIAALAAAGADTHVSPPTADRTAVRSRIEHPE